MVVMCNSIFAENGDASDRSVCFQIIQSNSKTFCLETRPTQIKYRCNTTRMEPENHICIFPIFINSDSTLQTSKAESQYSNIDNSTLVSKSSCDVIFSTFSIPNVSSRSGKPKSRRPLFDNKSFLLVAWKVTRKPCLSHTFQKEG